MLRLRIRLTPHVLFSIRTRSLPSMSTPCRHRSAYGDPRVTSRPSSPNIEASLAPPLGGRASARVQDTLQSLDSDLTCSARPSACSPKISLPYLIHEARVGLGSSALPLSAPSEHAHGPIPGDEPRIFPERPSPPMREICRISRPCCPPRRPAYQEGELAANHQDGWEADLVPLDREQPEGSSLQVDWGTGPCRGVVVETCEIECGHW